MFILPPNPNRSKTAPRKKSFGHAWVPGGFLLAAGMQTETRAAVPGTLRPHSYGAGGHGAGCTNRSPENVRPCHTGWHLCTSPGLVTCPLVLTGGSKESECPAASSWRN